MVPRPVPSGAARVGGGPGVSAVQPVFAPSGDLLFSADVSGWWAPQRARVDVASPVLTEPVEAEIGGPAWVNGLRWLAPLADGRLACSVTRRGSTGSG